MRSLWNLLGAGLVLVLVGNRAEAQSTLDFSPAYLNAVQDAQRVGALIDAGQPLPTGRIVNNLTTITASPTTPILMTAFTDFTGYNTSSSVVTDQGRKNPLFVTYGIQLYDFIRNSSTPQSGLTLRVNQLLGLPDNNISDRVVELIAQPKDIIRPERDPSITNPVSAVAFPAGTSQTYIDYFYNTLIDKRYVLPPGNTPYPFTQLGYTYDWSNPSQNVVGLSEFVILPRTAANPVNGSSMTGITNVVAVVSLLSYRYYDRQGNFDVQGDVDTIWAGSRYTPQGSYVNIRPNVTVSQGITVSSPGYTIFNAGTILGPGKNFDRTFRVVEFQNGGVLLNSGTIAGRIGVSSPMTATQPVVVVNSGSIIGTAFAIQLLGTADDSIFNNGVIQGAIQTGGGNDRVVIGGGSVSGSIDGGGGTNTLTFHVGNQLFAFGGGIANFQSVNINSGYVSLDGSVSGDVTVATAATLGESATLAGSLLNQGTVNPGNGFGSMSIANNYVQSGSGTLAIAVAKPIANALESNYLTVGGAATLAQGSTIFVGHRPGGSDVFRGGDRFQIIFATGGITDNGAQVRAVGKLNSRWRSHFRWLSSVRQPPCRSS